MVAEFGVKPGGHGLNLLLGDVRAADLLEQTESWVRKKLGHPLSLVRIHQEAAEDDGLARLVHDIPIGTASGGICVGGCIGCAGIDTAASACSKPRLNWAPARARG